MRSNVDAVLTELKALAAACEAARSFAADMRPDDPALEEAQARMDDADERFEVAALGALQAGIRDPRVLAVIAREYADVPLDGMRIDGEALRDGLAWRLMIEDLAA